MQMLCCYKRITSRKWYYFDGLWQQFLKPLFWASAYLAAESRSDPSFAGHAAADLPSGPVRPLSKKTKKTDSCLSAPTRKCIQKWEKLCTFLKSYCFQLSYLIEIPVALFPLSWLCGCIPPDSASAGILSAVQTLLDCGRTDLLHSPPSEQPLKFAWTLTSQRWN